MTLSPLDNSVTFKKLFRDPEVLSAFFKDLTGIDAQFKAEDIELEKHFNPPIGQIDTSFDIFAQDAERRVIIEIQRVTYNYLIDRFTHYHHAAIMELQRGHKHYQPNRIVHTIIWLTFKASEPPFNQGVSRSRYYLESTSGVKSAESPHRLYVINPNYLDDSVPKDLADWLKLVAESMANPEDPQVNLKRPVMVKATELIAEETLTPQERSQIMDELEWLEKLSETEEKGVAKGAVAERERMIQAMLAAGMSIADAARFSGLSQAQVAALSSPQAQEKEGEG